ncbi:MAG: HEPN domain-containing protein [Chloroflexi bacterium]|nr:HEPN domain-containing protein [Chloroflexota bacterium]
MRKEAQRWLRQAEADLAAAKSSLAAGHYEWACFQAQQSAEKDLKAFLYDRGYTSILSHSLKELLRDCQRLENALSSLSEEARFLDMFYIPTRYPNGMGGDLAPVEFYERSDAEKCLSSSESILNSVKSFLKS